MKKGIKVTQDVLDLVDRFFQSSVEDLACNTFDELCSRIENATQKPWFDILFQICSHSEKLSLNSDIKSMLKKLPNVKEEFAGEFANLQRYYAFYYHNSITQNIKEFVSFSSMTPGEYRLENSATGMGKSHTIHTEILNTAKGKITTNFDKVFVLSSQYRHHTELMHKLQKENVRYAFVSGATTLAKHQIEYTVSHCKLDACPSQSIKEVIKSVDIVTLSPLQRIKINSECNDIIESKTCNRCAQCMYKNPLKAINAIKQDNNERPVIVLTSISKMLFGIKNKDGDAVDFLSDKKFNFFKNSLYVVEEFTESFKKMVLDSIHQDQLLGYTRILQSKKESQEFNFLNEYLKQNIDLLKNKSSVDHEDLDKIYDCFIDTQEALSKAKIEYIYDNQTFIFDKPIMIFSDNYGESNIKPEYKYMYSKTCNAFNSTLKTLYADVKEYGIQLHLNEKKNHMPINFDKFIGSLIGFLKRVFRICYNLVEKMTLYVAKNNNYKFFELCAQELFEFMMFENKTRILDSRFEFDEGEEITKSKDFSNLMFVKFLLNQNYNTAQSDLDLFFRNGVTLHELTANRNMYGMFESHEVKMQINAVGANAFFKKMRDVQSNNTLLGCSASLGIVSLIHQPNQIYMSAGQKPIQKSTLYHLLKEEKNAVYTKDFYKNFYFESLESNKKYYEKFEQLNYLKKLVNSDELIVGLIVTNSKKEAEHIEKELKNMKDVYVKKIEDGKINTHAINDDITSKFLNDKNKIFLIGHYDVISSGVNFSLQIKNENISHPKIKAYVGHLMEFAHLETEIKIDLNFLMFVDSKTHALGESSYGLLLNTINGEFNERDIFNYCHISDAKIQGKMIKDTSLSKAERFEWFFQTVGRLNRSFNSPKKTTVILNEDLSDNILQTIDWQNMVLPTKFWTSLAHFIQTKIHQRFHDEPYIKLLWNNPVEKLNAIYKKPINKKTAFVRAGEKEFLWAEHLRAILTSMCMIASDEFSHMQSPISNKDLILELKTHLNYFNEHYSKEWDISYVVDDFIRQNAFNHKKHVYVNDDYVSNYSTHREVRSQLLFFMGALIIHPAILPNIARPFIHEQMVKNNLLKHTMAVPRELNELSDVYLKVTSKNKDEWLCAIDVKNYNINNTLHLISIDNPTIFLEEFNNIESKMNAIQAFFSHMKHHYVIAVSNNSIISTERVWCFYKSQWIALTSYHALSRKEKEEYPISKVLSFLTYQQIYEYRLNGIVSQFN